MTWRPGDAAACTTQQRMWRSARLASLLLTFGSLAGCGLDDTLHRMDLADYQRSCQEFGFTAGTNEFAQCMQQQAAQHQRWLDSIHVDK